MNLRCLGPTTTKTVTVNGRSYTGGPGTVLDVLDVDANELGANGWTVVAPSGPTSARPTGSLGLYRAVAGQQFFDTTLSLLIEHDGATWRSVIDGNAV